MSEITEADILLSDSELNKLNQGIYKKADRLTEPLLLVMFSFGLAIAFFYDTWLIGISVGAICLLSYYVTKKLLPGSTLYQYVLSAVSAIFAAQYIYQMHGMAEMHFWVFISSTILIIYQNWKLQLPLILLVIIHHGTFAYLQYIGYKEIYFTQLAYMDLTAFLFHGALASCVCIVAAIWGHAIHLRTIRDAINYKVVSQMKAELQFHADKMKELNAALMKVNQEVQNKNEALRASEEELTASAEELKSMNDYLNREVTERTQALLNQNKSLVHHAYINAHKVRSPLARILGLVNLINKELKLELEAKQDGKDLLHHLNLSATELDRILAEVRMNLEKAEFRDYGK